MTSSPIEPTGQQTSAKIPSRGKVLCIFEEASRVRDIETAIIERGFSLLRARHGMHGYWMAITGKPDVIITDINDPELESNYLLECLNRNAKTRGIPVLAMVDAAHQKSARVSCLRNASVCVTKDIDIEKLVSHVDELAELRREQQPATEPVRVRSVDAFFSELGHERASRSPRIVTRMLKSQRRKANLVEPTAEEVTE